VRGRPGWWFAYLPNSILANQPDGKTSAVGHRRGGRFGAGSDESGRPSRHDSIWLLPAGARRGPRSPAVPGSGARAAGPPRLGKGERGNAEPSCSSGCRSRRALRPISLPWPSGWSHGTAGQVRSASLRPLTNVPKPGTRCRGCPCTGRGDWRGLPKGGVHVELAHHYRNTRLHRR
jgi:hypothetical protein